MSALTHFLNQGCQGSTTQILDSPLQLVKKKVRLVHLNAGPNSSLVQNSIKPKKAFGTEIMSGPNTARKTSISMYEIAFGSIG